MMIERPTSSTDAAKMPVAASLHWPAGKNGSG